MPHNNRNDTNSFILNVSNNQNLNNEHTIQDNITEPHQNTKQKKVKQPVELIIKINSNISVIASLKFVKNFFLRNFAYFRSNLGAWGKFRTTEIPQVHIFYTLKFSHFSDGTYALFFHKPIFYCSLLDFSSIFFLFCQKNSKSWTAIYK